MTQDIVGQHSVLVPVPKRRPTVDPFSETRLTAIHIEPGDMLLVRLPDPMHGSDARDAAERLSEILRPWCDEHACGLLITLGAIEVTRVEMDERSFAERVRRVVLGMSGD